MEGVSSELIEFLGRISLILESQNPETNCTTTIYPPIKHKNGNSDLSLSARVYSLYHEFLCSGTL